MQDYLTPEPITLSSTTDAQQAFITRTFGWMCLALILTGMTAFGIANSPELITYIIGNPFIIWGAIILELILVITLAAAIQRLSTTTALAIFFAYAVLNGLTFAFVLLAYTATSIAGTFLITAGTFGVMTVIGFTTKRDLTSIGSLALMALIGIILASIVNIFLQSEGLYWILTYAGVLVFVALIAYDTQKIKKLGDQTIGDDQRARASILGALTLYLDFINLFLYLLRIFGERK